MGGQGRRVRSPAPACPACVGPVCNRSVCGTGFCGTGFQPVGFIEVASNPDYLEEQLRVSAFNRLHGIDVVEIGVLEGQYFEANDREQKNGVSTRFILK